MTATILVADIGGTNCRFALFSTSPELRLIASTWHKTETMHGLDDVLEAYHASGLDLPAREADAFILALAGPVTDPLHGHTSNARLAINLESIGQRHSIRTAFLLNDFQAQAYACLASPGHEAVEVLALSQTHAHASPTIGIIGAGTGLGTASLIQEQSGVWRALAAEGGHSSFPFTGQDEAEFERFVRTELKLPYVRCDDVLTGRGLTYIHHFLEGNVLPPEEIGRIALRTDTPTLRWFSRFYGRMARNWALITMCGGGLYIAGGIAAKNPYVVSNNIFHETFLESPSHRDVLKGIPVRMMTDENSGLWGAAWFGRQLLGIRP